MSDTVQLCAFRVGSQEYVLDIMRVEEVLLAPRPTPLQGRGLAVHGVVALRGVVIPVIDLRRRLGVEPEPAGRLLVCKVGLRKVGLVVDRVTQVLRARQEDFQPAPGPGATPGHPVLGVCRAGERIFLMLDVKALLLPEGASA